MAKNTQDTGLTDQDKVFQALFGEGFAELRLERSVYKAEECGGVPVVGHIIDHMTIHLDDEDGGRDWPVFLFRTTRPTKGVSREGNVIDIGVDEEILVTAAAQIQPVLMRYATDPEVMYEVAVAPKSKVDIGGKRKMWTWRAAISQKPPVKREGAFRLAQKTVPQIGLTSNGTPFDAKTGEILAPVAG